MIVESAPGGDAMEIGGSLDLRQRQEILPCEQLRVFDEAFDIQRPLVERDFRLNTEVENGLVLDVVLTGWETRLGGGGSVALSRVTGSGNALLALDQFLV